MAKFRALITGRYSPEIEAISDDAPSEVEIRYLSPGEALADHVSDVDIIYGHIGEGDLAKAKSLRWVQVASAGVEGMMYPAFKESDIILTNSRRMHGSQIAEHAFALLLSLTRRIITQYDFMKEKRWEKAPCIELAGMTMGILGLGGIGRAIAARAKAFEFNVIAVDPEPMDKPESVTELGKLDWLPEFMAQSNVVVVCCPITPETHKLLSHEQFNAMQDGSYLVNISRGKVVDEDALIAALRSGQLAAAGLDVTYTEPCPPDSPLWTEPNVVLTAHTAGGSQHIEARTMHLFIDNLHRYVKGESLINVADKEKGY